MPNYEYECKKCGHRFEVFQKMTDAKLKKCPECGGKVERLIGPGAGIVFKGSGFYQTDYRSESYKKAAKSERPKSEAAKKEGGEAKGGEAKPETKAKPKAKGTGD
jgi:putative FmdB family regulatory protein